ncbi:uncharacterized protein F5891DRAFT_1195436 [Suillus fuscotomentosus]|uniref:Uncharacterized protein n=1 Tax=Suillus fuscotomentosus TaxID=1912939 RepID=A0AAD4DUZ3_9AGAM|nr:uncharacterized protein F5891DRAFT_1195436 [Suillus fuscotomentosus]KAG1894301.1 hypothetical protein F5891DRAFT_1195436 [Suillus fuscotomentosus]
MSSTNELVDKTHTADVCGDVVFLEIDGVLPNWNHYCVKVSFDTPGTKTIVFRLREGADPRPKPSMTHAVQTESEPKEKEEEHNDAVKFEEEDTMIAEAEDLKSKQEDNNLLDQSARSWTRCTAMPCRHLPQIGGNPDPLTRAILRPQSRPWRHIIRLFNPSEIPQKVADIQERKRKFEEYSGY